jgi:hypothetical protein
MLKSKLTIMVLLLTGTAFASKDTNEGGISSGGTYESGSCAGKSVIQYFSQFSDGPQPGSDRLVFDLYQCSISDAAKLCILNSIQHLNQDSGPLKQQTRTMIQECESF